MFQDECNEILHWLLVSKRFGFGCLFQRSAQTALALWRNTIKLDVQVDSLCH